MGNTVISCSLRGIEVFLKEPMIFTILFDENVLGIIYINFRGGWEKYILISPDIVLFIILKN